MPEIRDIRKTPSTIRELKAVESLLNKRDFFRHGWKPLIATAFSAIIVFDFIVAPAYLGYKRLSMTELTAIIKDLPLETQKLLIEQNFRSWSPLTLNDSYGVFFIAICAILAGVAMYGHKGKLNE